MSTDERSESLASQAAAWVPPWERRRQPDPASAAAQPPPSDDPEAHGDVPGDGGSAGDGGVVPPELPPIPGEATGPATVDAPQQLPGDVETAPTDVGVVPDLPVPEAIEAAEDTDTESQGPGSPVDAPVPYDGDDAGDMFDVAADDDVRDDALDIPATQDDSPAEGVPATEDDLPAEGVPATEDDPPAEGVPAGRGDSAANLGSGGESAQDDSAAAVPVLAAIPAQGRAKSDPQATTVTPRRRSAKSLAAESPTSSDTADGAAPAAAESDTLPPIDDNEFRAALEAILLVVDEPVAELQLAQIMEQPTERVASTLEDISAQYTAVGHGFDLRRAAGGWRLYTRAEYAPYVERFVLDGQSVRLTQAALETLAVVAYKQPVTRSRISVIRGVNCDGVMRTLVTRGLIEECGTESETGAFLYRTTVLFLEKLGLNSVDQLPPLAPFLPDDVEEVIDAQR